MKENNIYDDIGLAAQSKREQYMKEAQDYNLRHQIITDQKKSRILKATVRAKHLLHRLSLHRVHS